MSIIFNARSRSLGKVFHGEGSSGPAQTVHPASAISSSVAKTPTITATISVIPASAVSTSVAKTPSIISGTVVIVGGNFTLIHGGMSQLVFNDTLGNVIVPDSVTSGTPANVSVTSGGLCEGLAESGTSVITAAKTGYVSGTITITLSGSCLILDAAVGTSTTTNGAAVTTWNDSATNQFTGTGTYLASGVNSKPAVQFNGTSDLFSSPLLSTYNQNSYFELVCLEPTGASGTGTNRNIISTSISTTSGYSCQLDTSNNQAVRNFNGITNTTVGSACSLSNPHYLQYAFDVASGSKAYISVDAGSDTVQTGAVYTKNATAIIHHIGANIAGTGNLTKMNLYLRIFVGRTPTSTEIAQLKLKGKTLLGL